MSYGRFDIQIQRINRRRKAWKEEVNHIDRYYYEQKLSDYSEEEKSPEWYSDYEYAVQLHFCEEDLSEMTHYLTSRNYDRENKKIIPLSNKMLDKIESYCHSIESAFNNYNCGSPVWTDFLDKKYKLLKVRTNYSILLSKLSMTILLSITTAMFWGRNIGMGEDLSDIIRTLFQNNPE